MNEKIDGFMTEIKSLCDEYELQEGQLVVVRRVVDLANKLARETRLLLGHTDYDGKVVEDAKDDRDK